MKIAIFSDTFLPQINGVTNTLKRLGDYLKSQNIEYIFITPDQKTENELPYNIESFLSTPFLFYPECRFAFPNMLRLNRTLDKFKPDILFAMTEFIMGISCLLYGKKHHVPVITNYSTNFNTILKSYKLNVFDKPLERYLKWFHNEGEFTVTPSKQSQNVLHGLGIHNTSLFSRGIDTSAFAPFHRSEALRRELGIDERIALLYVGRLSAEKDILVLRESIHRLNQRYKDKICLVMTGEGPMKAELERTMPDNTIFTGYLNGAVLSQLYASCDVFTFPSSIETFGNVVLEAFASGLPVVGVNEGGVLDLIVHKRTGYIAKAKNTESFIHYTEMLISDDYLRKRFALRARKFADNWSWERVFEDLLSLCESIVHSYHSKSNKYTQKETA